MKTIRTKDIYSNRGSTLILLVIVIAVIIALGTSLMSVSMMHYRIKKSNTEIKQSFYMSEKGINTSFSNAYNLVVEAIADSIDKAEEYLSVYPTNINEAANIFSNNYIIFILGQVESRINKNENPKIEITNVSSLFFINKELSMSIKSEYVSNNHVEATIMADLIITVPDYDLIDHIDFATLIVLDNWKVVR